MPYLENSYSKLNKENIEQIIKELLEEKLYENPNLYYDAHEWIQKIITKETFIKQWKNGLFDINKR